MKLVGDVNNLSSNTNHYQALQTEGVEFGDRSIPRRLALFIAYTIQFFWKLLRIKAHPPMSPVMVHLLGTEFSVSDGKARTEMGTRNAIGIDEGVRALLSRGMNPDVVT